MLPRKIIVIFLCLALGYIGLFAFLSISFHWWLSLVGISLIFITEFAARWYKFKKCPIPFHKLRHRSKKPIPDISATTDQLPVESPKNDIVTSISQIFLKAWIQMLIHNDLSVLGSGTPDQLKESRELLLSQYHEVRADASITDYLKIVREIKLIELNRAKCGFLSQIMAMRYSEVGATALREHYAGKWKFTKESYISDLEMIAKAQIRKEIDYEQLLKRLADWEKAHGSDVKKTPEQRHKGYIIRLMDINKNEGVKYDINTMTVMEYAIAEGRLDQYVEAMKEQMKKYK